MCNKKERGRQEANLTFLKDLSNTLSDLSFLIPLV